MKKLFEKDEVWFAILWIIAYVVLFATADSLSEELGVPRLLTVFVGLLLSFVLYDFIRKNDLTRYLGLCCVHGGVKRFFYIVPLVIIASVNFWNGLTVNCGPLETALYILSMCFVGFLEEVIFRGLLFRGMCKTHVGAAIIVSSLTFGMGHAVNLLLGAPVADTLLQLLYASAVGFLFTAVFYVGGSILPCIATHIFVNVTSVFAVEPNLEGRIAMALVQSAVSIVCGLWILRRGGVEERGRK